LAGTLAELVPAVLAAMLMLTSANNSSANNKLRSIARLLRLVFITRSFAFT
jgi:hypothetical protein